MNRRDALIGAAAVGAMAGLLEFPAYGSVNRENEGWTYDAAEWLSGLRAPELGPGQVPYAAEKYFQSLNEQVAAWILPATSRRLATAPAVLVDGTLYTVRSSRARTVYDMEIGEHIIKNAPDTEIPPDGYIVNHIAHELAEEIRNGIHGVDRMVFHSVRPTRQVNADTFLPEVGFVIRYAMTL